MELSDNFKRLLGIPVVPDDASPFQAYTKRQTEKAAQRAGRDNNNGDTTPQQETTSNGK